MENGALEFCMDFCIQFERATNSEVTRLRSKPVDPGDVPRKRSLVQSDGERHGGEDRLFQRRALCSPCGNGSERV